MSLPVIILGAGGHAKVLIDTLNLRTIKIIGATSPDFKKNGENIQQVPIIGDDTAVLHYQADIIKLANGLGSIGDSSKRRLIFNHFKDLGYSFTNVIHPSVIISSQTKISEGVQIMAGAVIQAGTVIGKNSIINTKASVDHDCVIGDHVHIAPGVTLSGNISIGDCVHIGTGATIIQGIKIGKDSIVGAGAVVLKDVPEGVTVIGIPAKEVQL